MRIIEVTKFGGPEVLVPTEVADPVAAAGQVVVGVAAADVLFLDTQLRAGWSADLFGLEPPYVPGNGVAGRVLSAGQGVDPGWVGRRVVTRTGGFGGRDGYAEQVAVPVDGLIAVPDGLGLPEAAALLNDGATAFGLFDGAGIMPGERVLVLGAAGGLGTLLVQLAHTAGARVVGAARGSRKLDLVRELGADVVVDYSTDDWTDQVLDGTGPDLVLDGVGGRLGRAAFEILRPGARFSAHGAPSGGFAPITPAEASSRKITLAGIEQVQFAPVDASRLTAVALDAATSGRLKATIGQTWALDRAVDAHTAVEARTTLAKTVLLP